MKIYSVGRDEVNGWDLEYVNLAGDFEWLVYSYEADTYEGYGEAVALGNGLLHIHDMSHCSCFGPMDSFGNKGTLTVEEFLREKDSIHDYEARDEVESKVRELLNA